MQKTIIANINGIIFHIEEDAYEMLKNYLNEIKMTFSRSEDGFEIVADIENRIVELLNEQLRNETRQVIVLQDVEILVAKLGQPSDFMLSDDEEETVNTPPPAATIKIKRRLFRDEEHQKVGGVCAGIAAYLNVDPTWLRLASVFLFFMNGIMLPIYILLWIVLPKPQTLADKMAMQGEDITLASIQKKASEKMKKVQQNSSKAKNAIEGVLDLIIMLVKGVLKLGVLLLGGIVVLISTVMLIGSLFGTTLFIFNDALFSSNNFPFVLLSEENYKMAFLGGILLICIPVLFLLELGIRITTNRQFIKKTTGFVLVGIWIVAFLFFGVKMGNMFVDQRQETFVSVDSMLQHQGKYWDLKGAPNPSNSGGILFGITHDAQKIYLSIEPSTDKKAHLTKVFWAKGTDQYNASESCNQISYNTIQKGSTLMIPEIFSLKEGSLWREQRVDVTLKLPVGDTVSIHTSLIPLTNAGFMWSCQPDVWAEDKILIMTPNGLSCVE